MMTRTVLLLYCLLSLSAQAQPLPQEAQQTPPQAAIATAHPLATQAGKDILLYGGNAFDAAVAITAVLAVVEPYSSGLGGGGFWLIHDQKKNKTTMIDGREMAPGQAHRDMYLDDRGEYIANSSVNGPLAAGIPGTVAAMAHLAKNYGVLPLKQVLQTAIQIAEAGFPVTEHYRKMVGFRLEVLQQYEASAKIFLHNNEVPELGYLIVQKDLAQTLKRIAEKGGNEFYQGLTAFKMVNSVQASQGIWQMADLKNYTIKEREPIQFQYRDMTITSVPPPSSGGIALATILQILQNFDLKSLNDSQQTHLIVEAMRRAYRDRAEFLGDSDFVDVPVKRLSHPWYADGLRESIRLDKAFPSADLPDISSPKKAIATTSSTQQTEGQDTTHFSVLDTQGNRVSATMSINYPFGSGFTANGTGVLLNDEMDDFSARPGTPNVYGLVGAEANAVAPGKRPLSSMSPTFVSTQDSIALLGTPGGSRIITMVLLGILELEKGGTVTDWVTRPRFHHQYLPDKIFYEANALSEDTQAELQLMGHQLQQQDSAYGNMQAISWNKETGVVQAASDPRVEGQSLVFDVPELTSKIMPELTPEIAPEIAPEPEQTE
ncbi:gamma-glutamyltransferase [sulfur-oxidizing endosymbiont of Gigantopelta aegis]|uniref:gamma-glutamyltransferase n=1 Tax=sulfur-oxidizing endosymbiont of Gigantopelta aegis TaxID=2794934 RepID=UPI0018DB0C27|nr:gamma-glutamyltransferase [sulfur-oxidizing endosymbiont of Gigantopelta aegis]